MTAAGETQIHIDWDGGLDDAAREEWSRSLMAELNGQQAGAAWPAPGAALPSGSKSMEFLGMSPDIVLGVGALVSSWAVPTIQHWLERQRPGTSLTLRGKNADGEHYEITVSGSAPGELFAKLDPIMTKRS